MRCVSWDEFLASSESVLDEALRCGTPIYVRRGGSIVLEITPALRADQADEDAEDDRGSVADRWYAEQLTSDNI